MVGYHITSIQSLNLSARTAFKSVCSNMRTFWNPCPASIVNVSQVFFSSSIRTFDVVALTRPTVRYHLFESISIKLKVEFGFRLVS